MVSATVIVAGTMAAVPSNDVPPIVRAVANAVAVAALPVHEPDDPEVLPVTLPVRLPVKAVEVKTPVLGLYVRPVSVSMPCVPVAPSTNVG